MIWIEHAIWFGLIRLIASLLEENFGCVHFLLNVQLKPNVVSASSIERISINTSWCVHCIHPFLHTCKLNLCDLDDMLVASSTFAMLCAAVVFFLTFSRNTPLIIQNIKYKSTNTKYAIPLQCSPLLLPPRPFHATTGEEYTFHPYNRFHCHK